MPRTAEHITTVSCANIRSPTAHSLRLLSYTRGRAGGAHQIHKLGVEHTELGVALLVRGPVRTLAGLEGLMTVGGNVLIESTLLETLGGLSSLAVVRGSIQLPSNTRLTSLHGALPTF
jgi:hypothetical protein